MAEAMREVSWTDTFGRRWATLIPAEDPDSTAPSGLPLGPIPLDGFKSELPLWFEVILHNELFKRRIFTFADAAERGGMQRLMSAVQGAVKVGALEVFEHYRGPQPEREP